MGLELVVLGTASQSPTRERNHGGCVLRWGGEVVLFDPGEGSQRQLVRAGVSAHDITRICITHFHGDHCLGLSGVVQARALSRPDGPVVLHYGSFGRPYVEHLLAGTIVDVDLLVDHQPIDDGERRSCDDFTISARALDHTVPAVGWRLDGGPRPHLRADLLDELGIRGELIGRLVERGWVEIDGRRLTAEELSETRAGAIAAVVLDTRRCLAARELASGADLLVIESTYCSADEALAEQYGHMTAMQAAEVARDADVGTLVLTHYSSRYDEIEELRRDAAAIFPTVHAAADLDRIDAPIRHRPVDQAPTGGVTKG